MFKTIAIFCVFIGATAASAQQAPDPAELYGVRESVEQIDISPSGNQVVFLAAGTGRSTVVLIADVGSEAPARPIARADGNPDRMRSCRFVTNERLVCRISGMAVVNDLLTPYSRLISLDTDGRNITNLGQSSSYYDARVRQFDGEILDWLTPADGAVLMARDLVPEEGRLGTRLSRTANGLAVQRIDVRTLRMTTVEPAHAAASGYFTDGRGEVRLMEEPVRRGGADGELSTRVDYRYRATGSHDWQRFGSFDSATGEGMVPLAVDPELNAAYVLRKLNGRGALYRVKLDGTLASELVYANEHVDVDDVVRASHGARVNGVTFAEQQRRTVYFDPIYAALATSLSRAIPNLPLIDFGDASADGNRILVHAGSDTDAGRYYVYDRTTRQLNEILMVRPALENVAGATVRSVSYPAADGTPIPAYLTLPPGSSGRNLPAVILPHGGPAARDEWGFDWLAQYFAHLGYAVLQPNYRGSAGYGDQWLQQNGFRSWRTSIGDISAGARWLVAQGTADAHRMAIVGWSYGGYAALQAAATEPSLFKAVVAIAPVTDLQELKDDFQNYTTAGNVVEYVGSGPHIGEGSPQRNAAAIAAPVLLFHGDRDLNVNVNHSRRMDAALRSAGKRSEVTIIHGLEHDLADSQVRIAMLQRIGAFLQTELAAH